MSSYHPQAIASVVGIFMVLCVTTACAAEKTIPLGSVVLQTVEIASDGTSHMSGGIIVRFFSGATRRESFAVTNDVGIALVPLRPGNYCYEALTDKGVHLKLIRSPKDRCFELRKGELVEVGVEFRR